MSLFRTPHAHYEKTFNVFTDSDTLDKKEWENVDRINESAWKTRYDYEANMIIEVMKNNNISSGSILEIGSGPGNLSQIVQCKLNNSITYHLIDKPFAKKYFEDNKYKGKFFVKDISIDMDAEGLLKSYDVVICNDVLEHLLAPTNILKRVHELMTENSVFMVSVPNWRMAHQFLYRGLWDYDNFIYLMHIHQFKIETVYPSCLQTPDYPRLDSEETMPEELRRSWNYYFVAKRR